MIPRTIVRAFNHTNTRMLTSLSPLTKATVRIATSSLIFGFGSTCVLSCSPRSDDSSLPTATTTNWDPAANAVLQYESRRWFPGLGEFVQVVKTPFDATGERPGRPPQPLGEIEAEEQKLLKQKYSVVEPSLAEAIWGGTVTGQIDVVVYIRDGGLPVEALQALSTPNIGPEAGNFDGTSVIPTGSIAGASPAPLDDSQIASVESARSAAVAQIFDAITLKVSESRPKLEAKGLNVKASGIGIPVVFGNIDAAAVFELAKLDDVVLVVRDGPAQQVDHACVSPQCVDPIAFTHIDSKFNVPYSNYGDNEKVAIVEDRGGSYLWEDHEAFSFIQGGAVTYSTPLPTVDQCTSDDWCHTNVFSETECRPVGTKQVCIKSHGSRVASVIAATNPSNTSQPWGAAKVALYYPNTGQAGLFAPSTSVMCSSLGISNAYTWLASNSVSTANESYGCLEVGSDDCTNPAVGAQQDGLTQDYFARNYGVTVVKAAGNVRSTCLTTNQTTCPYTLNSICVGSVYSGTSANAQMSLDSLWQNPQNSTFTLTTDREEPDVVAFGGYRTMSVGSRTLDVGVDMNTASTTAWDVSYGTSFAAPVVTSLVALFKKQCKANWGGTIHERNIRAVFRNAAWGGNPDGWSYSTPIAVGASGADRKDGAGLLYANPILEYCDPRVPGPNTATGTVNVTTTSGGTPPTGNNPYLDGGVSPDQLTLPAPKLTAYTPANQGRRGLALYTWSSLNAGQRVRASISWDACPAAQSGIAPAKSKWDFDLFLYNQSTNTYVWGSQSLDDNNEGFDFLLNSSGTYVLILAWRTKVGEGYCGSETSEPVAWAARWWLIGSTNHGSSDVLGSVYDAGGMWSTDIWAVGSDTGNACSIHSSDPSLRALCIGLS